MDAKTGKKYCEYSAGKACVVFEGSTMFALLNYGEDKWKFQTALLEYLEQFGLYYEMGHAWSLSVVEG